MTAWHLAVSELLVNVNFFAINLYHTIATTITIK